MLLDDESFFYESLHNDLDVPLIFQQRLWGLPRMGAPVDTYLLQDLLEGRLPPYKLYIFLNAFRLDDARRDALARELRRDGRVALWIYAPGYINEAPDLDHMTDLTGFSFGKGEHAWGPLVHILDFEHPITRDLTQDLFWGTNSRLGPLFHLEDPRRARPGRGGLLARPLQARLRRQEFADWASVYSAAPNLPAPVLRGIARYAGVHLYSDPATCSTPRRNCWACTPSPAASAPSTCPSKPRSSTTSLRAKSSPRTHHNSKSHYQPNPHLCSSPEIRRC